MNSRIAIVDEGGISSVTFHAGGTYGRGIKPAIKQYHISIMLIHFPCSAGAINQSTLSSNQKQCPLCPGRENRKDDIMNARLNKMLSQAVVGQKCKICGQTFDQLVGDICPWCAENIGGERFMDARKNLNDTGESEEDDG